jgi:hypothetical protein
MRPNKALQLTGPQRVPIDLWYRLALNSGAPGDHRRQARQLSALYVRRRGGATTVTIRIRHDRLLAHILILGNAFGRRDSALA